MDFVFDIPFFSIASGYELIPSVAFIFLCGFDRLVLTWWDGWMDGSMGITTLQLLQLGSDRNY